MDSINYGGRACKDKKGPLWKFIDNNATFEVPYPEYISNLYFPLFNEGGMMSSITPDLKGDIKTSKDTYLLEPVTRDGLAQTKSSRNFWVYCENKAWSITGASAESSLDKVKNTKNEDSNLRCGFGWHKITRSHSDLKSSAKITTFVPANNDSVEISLVNIKNNDNKSKAIDATIAVPIFGRSVDNLRDHRHVTSLLNRFVDDEDGVILKPTMKFDENEHKANETRYAVLGFSEDLKSPVYIWKATGDFVGEGNGLDAPEAVLTNIIPKEKSANSDGKEAIGVIKFNTIKLNPNESAKFVVLLGITDKNAEIVDWKKKYAKYSTAKEELEKTKVYWLKKTSQVLFKSGDSDFNNWMRWVAFQPAIRKIYGCSFLPCFDYGYGGRGWRDIWQDCLTLLLTDPKSTRQMIVNNFAGVRLDGTNATIVGSKSGEFLADRNDIIRVWMDHGIWPMLTLSLYIEQTGDIDILFEKQRYS